MYKLTKSALLAVVLWVVQGSAGLQPVSAQPSNPSQRQITSGRYWIGGTGMALVVQGDRYYYSDETGQSNWKPISRLKYVQEGVVFGEGHYWCLSTLPGPRGMCLPNGWAAPESKEELDCNYALIAAHRKLLNLKRMESLTMTTIQVARQYPDHPADRPGGYEFLMVGPGGYDALASEKTLASISTAIITRCPAVSMVSFLAHPEGHTTYGLVNNQVKGFDCYDAYDLRQSPNPKPPWGYQACFP